jgi:hypothetical protein
MNNIQRNISAEKKIQETNRLNPHNITFVLIIPKERAIFMGLFEGDASFEKSSNTIIILDKTFHSLLAL